MADIPRNVLKTLEIIFVESVDEVLKVALLPCVDTKEVVAGKRNFAGAQEICVNGVERYHDSLDFLI
jgi:predicted ATP-dependent protease